MAGCLNTFPHTSFSQNVGLVNMTRVRSRYVTVAAGFIILGISLLPKVAFAVASIPPAVLGGAGIVIFGMVAAGGPQDRGRRRSRGSPEPDRRRGQHRPEPDPDGGAEALRRHGAGLGRADPAQRDHPRRRRGDRPQPAAELGPSRCAGAEHRVADAELAFPHTAVLDRA
ncbi:solute carrier family 23 protein [Methylobacterium oryzae CBMB20]